MGKSKRKPVPSMPYWYWMGQDGCWFCENRRNCGRCRINRAYLKNFGEKKVKGQIAGSRKQNTKYIDEE